MPREIKFRAWSILDKKMLNWGDIFNLPAWEIFPGTPEQRAYEIMQYTGLKDKNDKEIYDGDICKDEYGDIYGILWSDKFQFACKLVKTNYTLSRGLTFPLWQYDRCKENGYRQLEITGNIYENPELLEEGGQGDSSREDHTVS